MTYSNTEGLDKLLTHGDFKVDIVPKPTQEKLAEIIPEYDGLLIRSEVKVTNDILGSGKNLKLVVRAGTGVDNIDTLSATQKGVVVMNVPGGNTISAAEHTIAMLLALSRNIPPAYISMKAGEWKKEKFVGTELQGKVLGLIGLGRIGKEVARRAQAFEMKVLAYDPFISEEHARSLNVEICSLEDIYKGSDYISVHAPLNDSTRHLINCETISKMKTGVRLINCARGGIIDEKALVDTIKSKKVSGAAIDVFEKEPLPKDSPLLELENVVLTPHLGASTEEAQIKVARESSEMIIDFFTQGIIRNAVNIPSVDKETYKKLKPYLDMAEKIGAFLSQIIDGGMKGIDIIYAGDVSQFNTSVLTSACLKGLLTPLLDMKVNFVNAMFLAKDRGIKIQEIKTTQTANYTSLLTAKVITEKQQLSASGTIFDHGMPRIVEIKDMDVDIIPQGCMLFLENTDRPGIIGRIGTVLGDNDINIAGMQVGRKSSGGEAITIINIDTCPTTETLKTISGIDGVTKVKLVVL